ncbi:hypothetical protein JB92DRAFT_3123636 [Gautieria morchelliformis]|nr:hypothetical protein JB92DRAFT_3123636 [Gautieria morchelliformis]
MNEDVDVNVAPTAATKVTLRLPKAIPNTIPDDDDTAPAEVSPPPSPTDLAPPPAKRGRGRPRGSGKVHTIIPTLSRKSRTAAKDSRKLVNVDEDADVDPKDNLSDWESHPFLLRTQALR